MCPPMMQQCWRKSPFFFPSALPQIILHIVHDNILTLKVSLPFGLSAILNGGKYKQMF